MAALAIEFTSRKHTAGYRIHGDRIIGKGSAKEDIRPVAYHRSLYLQFAALDDRPEAFADFMGLFGPVTNDGNLTGESVADLIVRRFEMRRLVEMAESDSGLLLRQKNLSPAARRAIGKSWDKAFEQIGSKRTDKSESPSLLTLAATINAVLRPGAPDGRPALCLAPDTLWDAMLLQFMQAVTGDSAIRSCSHCGRWFEAGGAQRRRDAKFCSRECKTGFHNAEKVRRRTK